MEISRKIGRTNIRSWKKISSCADINANNKWSTILGRHQQQSHGMISKNNKPNGV